MAGTIHYLNADFDLSLRSRPGKLRRPSTEKAVRAMTVHGLHLGGAGDAVLTTAGIPGSFVEYLRRKGIETARTVRHPGMEPGMRFSPFGWNAEAARLNALQESPAAHPDLEVVRRVNSRAWSAALEKEHFDEEGAGTTFTSFDALASWLTSCEDSPEGWVVKADHGNAGLGNRRLRSRQLSGGDSRFVENLLAEDDIVVVEPWRRRLVDLCGVFTLGHRGEVEGWRLHETVCTRDGGLIGALFDGLAGKWEETMASAAALLAGALSREGYFGPVCFDAFVWHDGEGERLRLLADLNCRRAMSDGVHRLRRDSFPDRALYWRFFGARRLRSVSVEAILSGGDAFSPSRRRGILLTSPLTVEFDGRQERAPKLAVAFVGKDRDEAAAMERRFRASCE